MCDEVAIVLILLLLIMTICYTRSAKCLHHITQPMKRQGLALETLQQMNVIHRQRYIRKDELGRWKTSIFKSKVLENMYPFKD